MKRFWSIVLLIPALCAWGAEPQAPSNSTSTTSKTRAMASKKKPKLHAPNKYPATIWINGAGKVRLNPDYQFLSQPSGDQICWNTNSNKTFVVQFGSAEASPFTQSSFTVTKSAEVCSGPVRSDAEQMSYCYTIEPQPGDNDKDDKKKPEKSDPVIIVTP